MKSELMDVPGENNEFCDAGCRDANMVIWDRSFLSRHRAAGSKKFSRYLVCVAAIRNFND